MSLVHRSSRTASRLEAIKKLETQKYNIYEDDVVNPRTGTFLLRCGKISREFLLMTHNNFPKIFLRLESGEILLVEPEELQGYRSQLQAKDAELVEDLCVSRLQVPLLSKGKVLA